MDLNPVKCIRPFSAKAKGLNSKKLYTGLKPGAIESSNPSASAKRNLQFRFGTNEYLLINLSVLLSGICNSPQFFKKLLYLLLALVSENVFH